jgi:cobalt/nickel transport system permease protein
MALPALICYALYGRRLRSADCRRPFLLGAFTGATGILLTALMVSFSIAISGDAFVPAAKVMLLTYIPLMIVEAAVTGAAISFVRRVSPELLYAAEQGYG